MEKNIIRKTFKKDFKEDSAPADAAGRPPSLRRNRVRHGGLLLLQRGFKRGTFGSPKLGPLSPESHFGILGGVFTTSVCFFGF